MYTRIKLTTIIRDIIDNTKIIILKYMPAYTHMLKACKMILIPYRFPSLRTIYRC